jgi:hypothetical protein
MATGAHKDRVWEPAGRDPGREARDIEAAIAAALTRNSRLRHHRITSDGRP